MVIIVHTRGPQLCPELWRTLPSAPCQAGASFCLPQSLAQGSKVPVTDRSILWQAPSSFAQHLWQPRPPLFLAYPEQVTFIGKLEIIY